MSYDSKFGPTVISCALAAFGGFGGQPGLALLAIAAVWCTHAFSGWRQP
jgi:hypothetical protein